MARMEGNETAELLREIRDLQRAHLEKYTEALRNQETAIQQQREAVAVAKNVSQLQRRALLIVLIAIIVVLIALALTLLPLWTAPSAHHVFPGPAAWFRLGFTQARSSVG
jgi:hypothetical protein